MKQGSLIIFITIFFCCKAVTQNVQISRIFNPQEPTICIDPKHPNVILAANNISSYYISLDTGKTWTWKQLSSSFGVWGDPCLAVDTSSSFYFFHLSNPTTGGVWIDRIVCQKTNNNGVSFNDGSYMGLNGNKRQDKEWAVVDRRNNNIYTTWTQFDNYGTTNPTDSSTILFSRSLDGGNTWSTAKRINKIAGDCIDSSNTVEGAVPCVGLNGEIYVSWAGPAGLVFNKSLDYGETWLNKEILIDSLKTGWVYNIPGIYRTNGLPVTVCDLSSSPYKGTIYVNWSDQRNGSTNTDIWLAKSTDGGNTWSSPLKVNNDNTQRHQFLTWLTVDQITGYLYCVFYDRRNYSDNYTDVYLAISKDGGNTFTNHKISQSPFYPIESIFFGDYTNISAHNGIVRPIWTRLDGGQLSVWTDVKNYFSDTTIIEPTPTVPSITDVNAYPNPANKYVYISFKLPKISNIKLNLIDEAGKLIKTFINNEKREVGVYVEKIDLINLGLSAGVYYLNLSIDKKVKTFKQVIVQ